MITDNRELSLCTRIAVQKTVANTHGFPRKKRFALVYGAALLFVAQARPEEYGASYNAHNCNLIAERMTESLARKTANFDSVPIRATCAVLGVKFGKESIAAWLTEVTLS